MDLTKIKEKALEIVNEYGLELYDVEYVKEGRNYILRIIIDKAEGIELDDCVNVSHAIDPFLDSIEKEFKEDYNLEVTSPGAEKKLRTLDEVIKHVGRYVYVETERDRLVGDLLEVKGEVLELKVKNKKVGINYNDIKLIQTTIKF